MSGQTPKGGHGGLKVDINVTPLVDVVLVLLIIFIVVTPMLSRGKNVHLPTAAASESQQDVRDPIVLTVTEDRRVWLDNRQVDAKALEKEFKVLSAKDGRRELLVKADASVLVRELRPVLQTLKAAGMRRISFAVLGASGAGP